MDFVRVHDALTQARARLFDWIRPLSQEQYTQQFPFGMKTLRRTMVEIAVVEWLYTTRLRGETVPDQKQWPISEERQPTFRDLEAVWKEQTPKVQATLAGITDREKEIERRVTDGGKTKVFIVTRGEAATQMVLHEVHHRAQAMAMLRQLGVEAQNLDYIQFVRRVREEPAQV
ncbi:MAG: DinB family protein [bacterium]